MCQVKITQWNDGEVRIDFFNEEHIHTGTVQGKYLETLAFVLLKAFPKENVYIDKELGFTETVLDIIDPPELDDEDFFAVEDPSRSLNLE